jgi:hypothetical protein
MTMIVGWGTSPLTDSGIHNLYHWEWFAGQGAFAQFSARLLDVHCPIETDRERRDVEWVKIRQFYSNSWMWIQHDIASKMEHPLSRAIILNHYLNEVWVSIHFIYPQMKSLPEPRMLCPAHGMGANSEGDYFEDTYFMQQMKPAFWDPEFAHNEMSKRPLPALPTVGPRQGNGLGMPLQTASKGSGRQLPRLPIRA